MNEKEIYDIVKKRWEIDIKRGIKIKGYTMLKIIFVSKYIFIYSIVILWSTSRIDFYRLLSIKIKN